MTNEGYAPNVPNAEKMAYSPEYMKKINKEKNKMIYYKKISREYKKDITELYETNNYLLKKLEKIQKENKILKLEKDEKNKEIKKINFELLEEMEKNSILESKLICIFKQKNLDKFCYF